MCVCVCVYVCVCTLKSIYTFPLKKDHVYQTLKEQINT